MTIIVSVDDPSWPITMTMTIIIAMIMICAIDNELHHPLLQISPSPATRRTIPIHPSHFCISLKRSDKYFEEDLTKYDMDEKRRKIIVFFDFLQPISDNLCAACMHNVHQILAFLIRRSWASLAVRFQRHKNKNGLRGVQISSWKCKSSFTRVSPDDDWERVHMRPNATFAPKKSKLAFLGWASR